MRFDLDPDDVLATDAIRIIRDVVLPVDHIRPEDVTCFKLLCEPAKARWSEENDDVLLTMLERIEGTDHLLLGFLRDAKCSVLNQVEEHLIAFVQEVARSELRGPTSAAAASIIRAHVSRNRAIRKSRVRPEVGQLSQELQTRGRQTPATVLGVPENCLQDELKAAYHAKVRQWHPDNLKTCRPNSAPMQIKSSPEFMPLTRS